MQAAAYNHFAYNVSLNGWGGNHTMFVQYTPLASENIEVAVKTMMLNKLKSVVAPIHTEFDGPTVPRHYFACLRRNGLSINILQARTDLRPGYPWHQDTGVKTLAILSRQIRTPERVRQMYPQIDFTSEREDDQTLMRLLWNTYLERCSALCDELCLNDRTFVRSTLTVSHLVDGWANVPPMAHPPQRIELNPKTVTVIDAVLGRAFNAQFDQDLSPLALRRVLSAASFDAPTRVHPKDLVMIIPSAMGVHDTGRIQFMLVVGIDTKVAKAVYMDMNPAMHGASLLLEMKLAISEEIDDIAPGWQIQVDEPFTIMQLYRAMVGPMHTFHAAGLYSMYQLLYVPLLLPVAMAVKRKQWGGSVTPPPAIARLNTECMARIIQFALGRLH